MYGQCLVVEQVGGAAHQFQVVDKCEAGIAVGQVDGNHGARSFAELFLRQFVERVVGQPHISHMFDALHCGQSLGQFHGVGRLQSVSGVERFKSQ